MNSTIKIIAIVLLFHLVSCKNEKLEENILASENQPSTQKGKDIFEKKVSCFSCHKPSVKIIGPSLKEIAVIYKKNNASIISFLNEESAPIVDPSKYEIMKTNLSITKQMSKEELMSVEMYIYSFSD